MRAPSRLPRLTTDLPTLWHRFNDAEQTDFDCTDIGANYGDLTVTDNNGNVSTCTSTITVEDNMSPTAICQNLTVQLDATVRSPSRLLRLTTDSSDNLRHHHDAESDGLRLHGRRCEYGDLDGDLTTTAT